MRNARLPLRRAVATDRRDASDRRRHGDVGDMGTGQMLMFLAKTTRGLPTATSLLPRSAKLAKMKCRSPGEQPLRPHRAAKSRSPSSPILRLSASAASRGQPSSEVPISGTYAPADARRHQRLAAGRVLGKIVLRIAHRVPVDTRTERRSQRGSPGSFDLVLTR